MTRTQAWLLVVFLAVALFLNNADRHAVFAIFPLLKSDLKFTDLQLGLTGSLFLWVYALMNPIAGQIGDRHSKRKLVALSLVVWRSIMALSGLSRSAGMLLTCRALLGVSESLFMPAAMAMLASAHGPGRAHWRLMFLGSVSLSVGVALGGWLGSWVAQEFHWRLTFFSLGGLGLLYAMPYWAFLRGIKEEVPAPAPARRRAAFRWRSWSGCGAIGLFVEPSQCVSAWSGCYIRGCRSSYTKSFPCAWRRLASRLPFTIKAAIRLAPWAAPPWQIGCICEPERRAFGLPRAGFLLAAPCLFFIGHSRSLFMTKLAIVGFGLFGGLFLANLIVSSFDVVPSHTRASACGCTSLLGSMTSGFAALGEGKWKSTVGIPNMMTLGALLCVAASLLLMVTIRFLFQQDHERAGLEEAAVSQAGQTIPRPGW